MITRSYPAALAPAAAGVLTGVLVTTAFVGDSPLDSAYLSLPEYQLWRLVMIAQLGVYFAVAAYLLKSAPQSHTTALPTTESFATWGLTVLLVLLPNILVRGGRFPLNGQRTRMLLVVAAGLFAILVLLYRVGQTFRAFGTASDVNEHVVLKRAARDYLMAAGLVVTLATLGSGVLQLSLAAVAAATPLYSSDMTSSHVLAYGGYYTLLLFLFFAPVLVAERDSALRIAQAQSTGKSEDTAERLGLNTSLTEHIVSAFGVLSPLLGALASRLLG